MKCTRPDNGDDIKCTLCACKRVYYCGAECREANTPHHAECAQWQAEAEAAAKKKMDDEERRKASFGVVVPKAEGGKKKGQKGQGTGGKKKK
jgi:hypothetical protein